MRPFGCPVTILNTLDSLGKFEGKVDEGFLVRYSVNSKAFRVFNSRIRIVQETLHVNFLENKPNLVGNQTNPSVGFQDKFDAEKAGEEIDPQYVLFRVWSSGSINSQNNDEDAAFDGKEHDFDVKKPESEFILSLSNSAQSRKQYDKTKKEAKGKSPIESVTGYRDLNAEFKDFSDNSSNEVNVAGFIVPTIGQNSLDSTNTFSAAELEDITYSNDEDVVGAEADFNNLESSIPEEPKRVHQAPRAWYETLATYLLENGFQRGTIDQTLFIKKQKGDILLVQIYVDDIIFGATNKDLCKSFEKLMKDKFQMSSTRELTFFLGLQVKQKKDGIFISQDKYVDEILRKFGLTEGKSASTLIDIEKPFLKDPDGEQVDVHTYKSMIGSLMYLTSSRPNIMFACKKQTVFATSSIEAEYVVAASCCAQVLWIQNQLLDYGHKLLLFSLTNWCCSLSAVRSSKGVDCLPNEKIFSELARMGYEKLSTKLTFYKAFFSIHWKFLIHTILQSLSAKRTSWNEFSSAMTSAVICLSRGKKFNFSKYIFESLMRNIDSTSKFYIYPRFIQFLIRNQIGDLSTNTTKYTYPALTQKVFANMRRVEKGFSGVETPLFEGMLVEQVIEEGGDTEEHVEADTAAQGDDTTAHGDDAQEPFIPSPTPPPQQPHDLPSTSQVQHTPPQPQPQASQQAADFLMSLLHEELDAYAALTRRVKHLKLKKVGTSQRIDTSEDTMMDDASNQGRIIHDLDKDDVVALMDDKEEDKKKKEAKVVEDDQVQGRQVESQAKIYKIDLDHASKVLSMQEDEPAEVQEVVDVVTTAKLITEVVTAASEIVTAASTIIFAAELQVLAATINVAPVRVVAASTRRRKEWLLGIHKKNQLHLRSYLLIPNPKIKAKGLWLKSGEIKGLYMVKQRSRAGSYWNHVCCQAKLLLLDSAAEGSLMLLSQVNAAICYIDAVNTKLRLLMTSAAVETLMKK
nr:putative ribonuclease H-like domain-containing protein [Tanacetum cinerariifolium]